MVINRQRRVPVNIKPLQAFLARVQEALRLSEREVTVCLVSDAAIARMNRGFRHKRGLTDILSFPTNGRRTRQGSKEAGNASSASYLGDIAISPQMARRNARRFARTLPEELRILILHGMLHLSGYDHETDQGEMERLERQLRRRFGLS